MLIRFMRSPAGRITRVVFGVWLMLYGALSGTLVGLVLMLVGMVPAVTGIAGICPPDEIMKAQRGPRHV